MSDYSAADIKAVGMTEAIRKRPWMWLHAEKRQLDEFKVNVATLIAQQMCVHALYLAREGRPIGLHVYVAPNYIRVSYNAPLAYSDVIHDDELVPSRQCTWDERKHALHPLYGGLTIPIALSSHFHIHVKDEHTYDSLVFEQGQRVQRAASPPSTATPQTCLECWLDDELLGDLRPEHDVVTAFIHQHDDLTHLTAHLRVSESIHLYTSSIETCDHEAHLKATPTLLNYINEIMDTHIEVRHILRWCEGWPAHAWLSSHQGSLRWVPHQALLAMLDEESQELVKSYQEESKQGWDGIEWTSLSDIEY